MKYSILVVGIIQVISYITIAAIFFPRAATCVSGAAVGGFLCGIALTKLRELPTSARTKE